jgi:hypothetical protein
MNSLSLNAPDELYPDDAPKAKPVIGFSQRRT